MCEIDYEDYDAARVWRDSHRVARKDHRCSCCGGPIPTGSRYRYIFYVSCDGEAANDKACEDCDNDLETFVAAHLMTPFPSCFVDFLAECILDDDDASREIWAPMLERIRARQRTAAA